MIRQHDDSYAYGDIPAPHMSPNGSRKIVWGVATGLSVLFATGIVGTAVWFNGKLWDMSEAMGNLREQALNSQLDTIRQISVLTVEMTRATGATEQAVYRASIAERESRLAQEDLTMLRAAVRAHGIPADGAGDHDEP